ncbi:hypothetical protein E3N88_00605 [Mikania micrantha]|uniref:Uncharacterized protein n=1 Tax=Mikania micrantha TaxID=192012 RepID=A0A5N6PYL5_9ASTR|nr:hypothetical protein E3N88_00605 [Mikania micrantha]
MRDDDEDDEIFQGSRVDMEVDDVDQDDRDEDIDSGIKGRLHSDSYETGSQHESSDDDESTVGQRGPVAPTPLSEPRNRFLVPSLDELEDISKEGENRMFDRFKDKLLERPATVDEIWMQSQRKEETKPLDKLLISKGGERSQESGNLDEIDLQTTVEWVDTRPLGQRILLYGDDASKQPLFDPDSWIQAVGGRKKDRVYGFSDISDIHVVMTGTSSMPTNEQVKWMLWRRHKIVEIVSRGILSSVGV